MPVSVLQMQSVVSRTKSPLPKTLIGSHLHFLEVNIPKATTARRGPIQLESISAQSQTVAPYARTALPKRDPQMYKQAKSPSRRRPEGRRRPRSEGQDGIVAAMPDSMTTTELRDNIEQYKVCTTYDQ